MDPKNLPPSVLLALGLTLGTQEGCCPVAQTCLAAPIEDDMRPCLSPPADLVMPPCLSIAIPPEEVGVCLEAPQDTGLVEPNPPVHVGPCLRPVKPDVQVCLEFMDIEEHVIEGDAPEEESDGAGALDGGADDEHARRHESRAGAVRAVLRTGSLPVDLRSRLRRG